MSEDIKVKVKDVDDDVIEEIEVSDMSRGNVGDQVGNILKQVFRFQVGLVTLPINLLPSKARYHAKNSIKEGFLAVRSLVDGVNDGIEDTLTRTLERDKIRFDIDVDDEIRVG
jgi:hypothetical protein